jgi:hypothetical protein
LKVRQGEEAPTLSGPGLFHNTMLGIPLAKSLLYQIKTLLLDLIVHSIYHSGRLTRPDNLRSYLGR